MAKTYETLTTSDIAHFIEKGHVILRDCCSRDLAAEWCDFAFKRLGYDPDDATTWEEQHIHLSRIHLLR